ncbi:Ddi1p PWA37_002035 [Arxiozyma heterogenica]|uniref:DNA damage-inducible protein 1 n=1 Tax=Arxiozyma heterogenica TaxID=278026 RepID=A0AAN7WTP1_9SACH|nr:hypothetical protein RI543_001499 [Kazachstania heterogenica]
MHLTISNEITGQIYGPIEINDDMKLEDLIALLEVECQFDPLKNDLYINMDILDLNKSKNKILSEIGLHNDELLLIKNKIQTNNNPNNSIIPPGNLDNRKYVEEFRKQLNMSQPMRQQLVTQMPELDSILNDSNLFYERMGPIILQRRYGGFYQQSLNPFGIPQDEYNKLMSNPDNPINQKRINELIDQQAIDEQLRNAYEHTPEVFTTVSMLYINLEINGHPVKAFVDTGAQMTIMSTRLAEATGLSKLIDRRFIGEVRGVGRGKIIGRIHQAQIKIETQYICNSFVVLDTEIDVLIGLDMLKRHQACIDLAKNVLRIAGIETRFLSEAEIPKGFENEVKQTASKTLSKPTTIPNSTSTGGSVLVNNTNNTSNVNDHNNIPIQQFPRNNNISNMKSGISGQSRNNILSNMNFPESIVKQLMDLGFSRNEVIRALRTTGGNAEYAAALLFQ